MKTTKNNGNRRVTASGVTDLLFEQMNRLNDTSLSDEGLGREVKRADAMCDLASQIISNNRVQVEAWKTAAEYGDASKLPALVPSARSAAPAAGPRRIARVNERS